MTAAALASAAFLLVTLGLGLVIAGVRKTVPISAPTRKLTLPGWARLTRRQRITAAIATAAGLATALVTGWTIAIVILPVAALGLPVLLGSGDAKVTIGRLEAMEAWTRSLAGVLGGGMALEQAIKATLKSTPEPIRREVGALVYRLSSRTPTVVALRAFAEDLHDATGDKIAAALILGAERRTGSLSSILEGLAASVAEDVRARRTVDADRARPRSTARQITAITVVALIGFASVGDYVAPYRTPLGQMILALILAAYVAVLLWMRSSTLTRPAPRILGGGSR